MKTTIDIPSATLEDAIRFTGAKTKREAVLRALEEFNRRQRVNQFIRKAMGAMPDLPGNDEIEAADAEREAHLRTLWDRRIDA